MPFMPRTRAALLIETFDKDGNKQIMIYHLTEPISMVMEQDYSMHYNMFDGVSRAASMPTRLSVEAYLADPNPQYWEGPMPDPDQQELPPAQIAITSNDDIIEGEVLDDEGFGEGYPDD